MRWYSLDNIVEETRLWIKNIVIGHNFCPFASKPFKENKIRYFVSLAEDEVSLIDDVISELLSLRKADPSVVETTILIVPVCFDAFDDYNQFIDLLDVILEKLAMEGEIQIATFHPDYCFADLSYDDVRNYTNRSLYPMFHFIREDSVASARAIHPDIDGIPEANMEKLESLGLNKIRKQIASCFFHSNEKN